MPRSAFFPSRILKHCVWMLICEAGRRRSASAEMLNVSYVSRDNRTSPWCCCEISRGHTSEHSSAQAAYRRTRGKGLQMVNIAHGEWVITSQAKLQSVYSYRIITNSAVWCLMDRNQPLFPQCDLLWKCCPIGLLNECWQPSWFFFWSLFRPNSPVGCRQTPGKQ